MDFKGLLSKVAPVLGGMIGGPFGAVAGKAVSKILTPGNDDPTDHDLSMALDNATPEQIAKIREIDAKYKTDLAKLEIEDRKNARLREIALNDKMPSIIATVNMLGFFGIMFLLFFDHISPKNSEIIDVLIGSLSTVYIQTIAYYFGTNKIRSKERK